MEGWWSGGVHIDVADKSFLHADEQVVIRWGLTLKGELDGGGRRQVEGLVAGEWLRLVIAPSDRKSGLR